MEENSTILTDDWINGTNYYWNDTLASDMITERPYWIILLDKITTIIMTANMVMLLLGMGASTHIEEFWLNMKRPWGSIIGMMCQFGLLPAIGFGLSIVLQLTPYQALGVLILTCSPGGAFSNFFTYWADGDIALSILMTFTSSVMAFGGMPLNLFIYSTYWTDEQVKVPYLNVLISMCFVTGPAIVGMLIRHYKETWGHRISKFCGILGWVGSLICSFFLFVIYWDMLISVSIGVLVAAACVPLVGFTVAYLIARILCMNHKVSRTIGIETGCQNMPVAGNVILFSFPDVNIRSQMVMFPAIYGLFQLSEVFIAVIVFQIYKFIHRVKVTDKAKSMAAIVSWTPIHPETEFLKRGPWNPYPELLINGERILTKQNLFRSSSVPQLSSNETIPFLEVSRSQETSTGTLLLPDTDVSHSGRRFSDQIYGTLRPENPKDKASLSSIFTRLTLTPPRSVDFSHHR